MHQNSLMGGYAAYTNPSSAVTEVAQTGAVQESASWTLVTLVITHVSRVLTLPQE
ncbi:hypothetical protein AB0D49_24635 [Streptomyces sp. NPDC048290]|uniref:hypothetical protein n=1 Tax=Streptomyces sp. NPDC048290 TaxID=3155811 RepID=UPI003430A404